MRAKRQAKMMVKKIAFSGMSQPEGTVANQVWKGTPLSRAKANSWREALAMFVICLGVSLDGCIVVGNEIGW